MVRQAVAVFVLLVLVGCSSSQSAQVADAEATLAPMPPVAYGDGFFELESNSQGSWRWMGPEGIVLLANTEQPMVLHISGRVPAGQLAEPPTITVELNGEILDQWNESAEQLEREYIVSPEQQGPSPMSELRVATSQSFVPNDVNPESPDRRRLALVITQVAWDPQ